MSRVENGSGTPLETVQYQYDAQGRLWKVIDSRGTTEYSYDPQGRTTRVTGESAREAADPATDVRYTYDELGRLQTVRVIERNGQTLAQPEETTYRYDPLGNLDRTDQANGVVSDYIYDDLGRLEELLQYAPDSTPEDLSDNPLLARFDYELRADGKRSAVDETLWIDGTPHTSRTEWTYDAAGRLVDEIFDHYDDSLDFEAEYVYDLVGNRLAKITDQGADGTIDEAITYAYDENDRLLTETKDLASGTDTTTTYTYGGPGNPATMLTAKTTVETATGNLIEQTTYTYDPSGRLAQALIEKYTAGNVVRRETTAFAYDDSGIRTQASTTVEIDHDSDPGTPLVVESQTETTYLNDKQNPTGYSQLLEETHRDPATGNVVKTLVYTNGQDVLAQTTFTPGGPSEGETLHLLYDGHGSTRALTDSAGLLIPGQIYAYDAYGNAVGFDPATAQTSLLYTGEQFDSRLNLQNLRARLYDAVTGRFISLDPFAGHKSVPQSLHKYTYGHGDGINWTDPSGQSPLVSAVVTGAIKATLFSMVVGAISGAVSGAFIGGVSAGALHYLQTGSTQGLLTAVGNGALYGAIYGAIVGASSVNPILLALTVNVMFGISVYHTVPLLLDPQIKPQTKVALVFFLFLGGYGAYRANTNATAWFRDFGQYGKISHAEAKAALAEPPGVNQKLGDIWGSGLGDAQAALVKARAGLLKPDPALTRHHFLSYRRLAGDVLQKYWTENHWDQTPVAEQIIRWQIIDALLYSTPQAPLAVAPLAGEEGF